MTDPAEPTGPKEPIEPIDPVAAVEPIGGTRSIGRSGLIVASGTMVSRVLGFINALLLYNTIGAVGQGADAFVLANTLPNNIYLILAGGTLTAVIVPAIVRSVTDGDGGQRFLNRLVTLGVSVFAVVAIAATVAAPLVVQLYAQSGSRGFAQGQIELAIAFAYWCLPQVFFYAVIAILSEVLNAKGKFWPYAWTPVVNNVVLAAVLIGFRVTFGEVDDLAASAWTNGMVVLLAGGATLGIVVQTLALILAFRQAGLRIRPDFHWRDAGLSRFGRLAAWTFGATLVSQAAGIFESNVLSLATGSASIAAMTLAQAIYILPYSIVTISIAVPYFTRMSRHAQAGDRTSLGDDLTRAVTAVLLFQVFFAVSMAIAAPWIATLFTSEPDGRIAVAAVLACTLIGLVPASVSGVLLRGWYALDDTRTPFIMQTTQVVLYVLALVGIAVLRPAADGIAVAAALSLAGAIIIYAVLSVALIRRKVPSFRVSRVLGRLVWFAAAMVPAAAVGWWLSSAVLGSTEAGAFPGGTAGGALLVILVAGLSMLVVYLGVLLATRNPELLGVLRPIRARLTRRAE
jgi:putative peptidoglycan lipid II flippase